MPNFPSGISINGDLIFGSNNDPSWSINNNSLHEKKVKVFDLSSQTLSTFESKGYPHVLFENHLGQVVSISSGFKRSGIESFGEPKPDLFVEIIEQ